LPSAIYFSLAYSAFARIRIGTSAQFQNFRLFNETVAPKAKEVGEARATAANH
jgi:hypothetical protein